VIVIVMAVHIHDLKLGFENCRLQGHVVPPGMRDVAIKPGVDPV
jgi:hypothetical protein